MEEFLKYIGTSSRIQKLEVMHDHLKSYGFCTEFISYHQVYNEIMKDLDNYDYVILYLVSVYHDGSIFSIYGYVEEPMKVPYYIHLKN